MNEADLTGTVGRTPMVRLDRLAKGLPARIGRFTYSKHAKDEMLADDLTTVDCENVGERHGAHR